MAKKKELECAEIDGNPFEDNSFQESDRQKNEEARAKFEEGISAVNSDTLPFERKLDKLIDLNNMVLPYLFKELYARYPNADRSVVGARICIALKTATDILIKKRESEVSEEINPDSPKFQKAFEWFIEVVRASMEEAGMDSVAINNTFNVMANRLQGWENLVSKSLKGVSSKALSEVQNPFVKDFISQLHGEEKNPEIPPRERNVEASQKFIN